MLRVKSKTLEIGVEFHLPQNITKRRVIEDGRHIVGIVCSSVLLKGSSKLDNLHDSAKPSPTRLHFLKVRTLYLHLP